MHTAKTLIDNAVKMCNSESELARRLGVFPQDIHQLKTGKRVLSPELAALIADVAGMDPRQAALDAVIERDLRKPDGGRVAEILGKALVAGAVATWLLGYAGYSIGAIETAASKLTVMHIVLSSLAMGAALRVLASATRTRTRTRIPLRCMSTCLRVFVSTRLQPARYAIGALSAAFAGMDRPGFACRKTAQK